MNAHKLYINLSLGKVTHLSML